MTRFIYDPDNGAVAPDGEWRSFLPSKVGQDRFVFGNWSVTIGLQIAIVSGAVDPEDVILVVEGEEYRFDRDATPDSSLPSPHFDMACELAKRRNS